MIQMLYLQLFAVLVALPFLDGFLPTDPECVYKERPTFCRLVLAAYRQNRDTVRHMSSLQKFGYAISKLGSANAGIYEALRRLRENRTHELLEPLGLALDSESSAVTGVLTACNNSVTEKPCSTIFKGILDATEYLVEAIIDISDREKKITIQKLVVAFGKETNRNEKFPGFLTDVLKVLNLNKGPYLNRKQR